MTDCSGCDWRDNRLYIKASLESLLHDVSDIKAKLAVVSSWVEMRQRDTKPLSKIEIESVVHSAVEQKRNGNPDKPLTESEVRAIVSEVTKPSPAKGNSWEPWRYVLLGAVIAIPQIIIEGARLLTGGAL